MAKTAWTLTVRKRSVDERGAMVLDALLLDAGVEQADITVTISADRQLMLLVTPRPGVPEFIDFRALMKGAS